MQLVAKQLLAKLRRSISSPAAQRHRSRDCYVRGRLEVAASFVVGLGLDVTAACRETCKGACQTQVTEDPIRSLANATH